MVRPMSDEVIDLHDRDAQIFEAWVQGDRVADIAQQFRCPSDAVLKAIDKFVVVIDDDFRRRLMTREVERLETMHARFFQMAREGDHAAAHVCVKIGERRARLLGLDAPQQMDMTLLAAPRGNSTDRLKAVLDRLIADGTPAA
jgi:hypothetical protein